jgi:hypothetical protein
MLYGRACASPTRRFVAHCIASTRASLAKWQLITTYDEWGGGPRPLIPTVTGAAAAQCRAS